MHTPIRPLNQRVADCVKNSSEILNHKVPVSILFRTFWFRCLFNSFIFYIDTYPTLSIAFRPNIHKVPGRKHSGCQQDLRVLQNQY